MKEPWIPLSGDDIRKMGKARGLLDFLVSKQTDPNGKVYYGKPVPYRWMQMWLSGEPQIPKRTIQDWMRRLRNGGYIETQLDPGRTGLCITILNQKKFAAPGPFAPQKASGVAAATQEEQANGKQNRIARSETTGERTRRLVSEALRDLRQA